MTSKSLLYTLVLSLAFSVTMSANEDKKPEGYNPSPVVVNHISDGHEFHLFGDLHIPLPCFLYAKDKGLTVCMSSIFHHGEKAYNGFALDHGIVKRIKGFDSNSEVEIEEVAHHTEVMGEEPGTKHFIEHKEIETAPGTKEEVGFVKIAGKEYELEESSKLIKMSSWYDFSITKNVFTMLLALGILFFLFLSAAKGYKTNAGKAPKGIQAVMEPLFLFVRDEIAKPSIGPKYEKYFPFILSLFFFIFINNVIGLIPIFPFGGNVMGNVSSTLVLALITFVIVNVSGNKSYWQHIFWMPGVPVGIKLLMMPVEFLGVFIKPFTLFIRLFANIVAGHAVILSLVSLVFIFGEAGKNVGGSFIGIAMAVPFTAFMNLLEILVAFLQAFIFALLASLYIGAAIEDHHVDAHGVDAHDHFI
jgi:F-type H+-transporting ATPase subunit a